MPIDIFLSQFDFIIRLTVMMQKKNSKMNHTAKICYDKFDQMKKVTFYGLLKIPPQNSQIQIEALFFQTNV